MYTICIHGTATDGIGTPDLGTPDPEPTTLVILHVSKLTCV